jgi:DnaJ-like protein
MMAVPRRSEHAADEEAHTHVNGTNGKVDASTAAPTGSESTPVTVDAIPEDDAETSRLPILADAAALPALPPGPTIQADPGVYAVLGLDPSASDAEIQTTYRRQAAKLMSSGSNDNQALKRLNVAYEMLGNPVRRAEYDRMRLTQALMPNASPNPVRPGAKVGARVTRRRRPRHAVQPRYAGLGDVIVVLTVVGLAVVAGFLLIPRFSVNLSALNALQAVLPLQNSQRRVIDVTVTAVPTPQATATPPPSISARYSSSTVSVTNPTPAQNSSETVQMRLRRDGQAVPNADVWATVQYRTTEERWPTAGAVKTDANGLATITFNIGTATPNYPVAVHVFTQLDGQELTWSTTFTPQ